MKIFLIGHLPHKHKLVICGNHELSFDPSFKKPAQQQESSHRGWLDGLLNKIPLLGYKKENIEAAVNTFNIRDHLTNCTYLEDSGVEVAKHFF